MKKPSPLISVVIPAYNEAARIAPHLELVRQYLEQTYPLNYEIIVVDDGSRDATARIVTEIVGADALLRLPKNSGKGAAVRRGMLHARGDRRLFLDADGSTPIGEEKRLANQLANGAEIVLGSRAVPDESRTWVRLDGAPPAPRSAGNPLWEVTLRRHCSGRVFAWLVNRILGLTYFDTQCGFKMFTARAAIAVFSRARIDHFAFDVEILWLAKQLEIPTSEVAVRWKDIAGSKVELGRDGARMLWDLLQLRFEGSPALVVPTLRRE